MNDVVKYKEITVNLTTRQVVMDDTFKNVIVFDLNKIAELSKIYEALCTMEFIYDNYEFNSLEDAWIKALEIREYMAENNIVEDIAINEVIKQ